MLSLKSFPQTVFRNVVASGGNSITTSGYSISSTIGQIPFKTLCETTNALTQGFEQPATKVIVNPGEFIQVFPNPVVDYLNVVFSFTAEKDFVISIFSLSGSELQSTLARHIQSGVLYTIDFSSIPSGMYLLHIYEKSAENRLFKVIKIEKFSKTQ